MASNTARGLQDGCSTMGRGHSLSIHGGCSQHNYAYYDYDYSLCTEGWWTILLSRVSIESADSVASVASIVSGVSPLSSLCTVAVPVSPPVSPPDSPSFSRSSRLRSPTLLFFVPARVIVHARSADGGGPGGSGPDRLKRRRYHVPGCDSGEDRERELPPEDVVERCR